MVQQGGTTTASNAPQTFPPVVPGHLFTWVDVNHYFAALARHHPEHWPRWLHEVDAYWERPPHHRPHHPRQRGVAVAAPHAGAAHGRRPAGAAGRRRAHLAGRTGPSRRPQRQQAAATVGRTPHHPRSLRAVARASQPLPHDRASASGCPTEPGHDLRFPPSDRQRGAGACGAAAVTFHPRRFVWGAGHTPLDRPRTRTEPRGLLSKSPGSCRPGAVVT